MQGFISHKFNKRILCILILFVMIYTIFSFSPKTMIKSYGATYTYSKSSNNLPSNFDTIYPGYRILLNTLVSEHPNWTFKLLETNLDWNTVLNCESIHGKNLVQPGFYTSDWGCSCGGVYDDPWKCASRSAVEYMMDPRNFLNGYDVFQFQEITSVYGGETKEEIRKIIEGTFMDTDTYREDCIKGIMEASKLYNISPYFIASKIIQEQGTNGSSLSSGQGYNGQYEGYYNLFNMGAYPHDERRKS